jgi:DNA-binding CsgD family transcriptional regulator
VEAERARLDGRPDPDAWKRAVEAREAIAQPYDAALGRVRLAEALSQAGASQDELAPVLDRARATAETLGLTPVLAALDRLEPGRRRQRVNGRAAGTMPVDEPGLVDLGLSPRELEVLALVAVGRTNREIGDALFISAKTASVHITHILDKLGVSSRVEAALLAASVGLAPADAALVPATVKVAAET